MVVVTAPILRLSNRCIFAQLVLFIVYLAAANTVSRLTPISTEKQTQNPKPE